MLRKKVNSSQAPIEVEVFPTGHCYIRKNITEKEDEEMGKYFEYDEVFFESEASKEEIEADLETFWVNGIGYGVEIPLEERLATIEEAIDMLMEE